MVSERIEEFGWADEVRSVLAEDRALPKGFPDETELESLYISQATVDELRGSAGRARGEVLGLEKAYGEPACRCVEGDACTNDAPSDHKHVEMFLDECLAVPCGE